MGGAVAHIRSLGIKWLWGPMHTENKAGKWKWPWILTHHSFRGQASQDHHLSVVFWPFHLRTNVNHKKSHNFVNRDPMKSFWRANCQYCGFSLSFVVKALNGPQLHHPHFNILRNRHLFKLACQIHCGHMNKWPLYRYEMQVGAPAAHIQAQGFTIMNNLYGRQFSPTQLFLELFSKMF